MLQTLRRQPDNRMGSAKHYRVAMSLRRHFPKPFRPMKNEDCGGKIPASQGRSVNSFKGLSEYGSKSNAIIRGRAAEIISSWHYIPKTLLKPPSFHMAHQTHTITWSLRTFSPIERKQETQARPHAPAHAHTKVVPGRVTKGTGANSVFESASSRLPVHKFTVNIKPLERRFMCCLHTGQRSQRATRPSGEARLRRWPICGCNGDVVQTQSPGCVLQISIAGQ